MNNHERYGSAPLNRGHIVFTRPGAQEEWDDMDPMVKAFVMKNLADSAKKVESEVAIEMLCHVINDLVKRIEVLENAIN